MDVIRFVLIGTAGLLLAIILKEVRPEYALYVSLATGICLLLGASVKLNYLMEMLQRMKEYLPVDTTYLNTLLKMIGITYIGQFGAGLCKDAGYSSIAGQIELFSKLSILALSMPVLLALLDTVYGFLA